MVGNSSGSLRDKVIRLLEREGPQSVNDLCSNLGISNGSSRSVLVKLCQTGQIERVTKGIYRMSGDDREYSPSKPF